MVESRRVPGQGRIRASIEKVARRVQKKGRMNVRTEKWWNPGEYRKIFPTSTGNGSNQCEYRKMVESERVPGKGRIHGDTEKLSSRVLEKVEYVRIPKNCPGEYWKRVESVRVLKMVECGRVPGKGRVRLNTKKLSGRVLENGRISDSTGKR